MANEANPALGTPKLFPELQGKAPEKAQLSEESKNVFTELFGKDASQKNPAMMSSVVAQSDKKGISYFGAKPETPELSLKKFAKHSSKPGSAVLKASLFLLFLTAFGFATQTSSRLSLFGVNPALRFETAQEQVNELRAEVLVQKNLAAALLLDQFSSAADDYLYAEAQVASEYTSSNKREEYQRKSAALMGSLRDLLFQIQTNLNDVVSPEQNALANTVADDLIAQLQAQSGSVEEQSLLQEVHDLQTAKSLIQDAAFRAQVTGLDLETLKTEEIRSLFEGFSRMDASLTATINAIKSTRTAWSLYLDQIESLTKKVDPLFNTEFQSNLTLTDIVFKEDGSVSVSGETSTQDTKNFTLVSNLIDGYEASPYFENVEERSYAKSGSDELYTGSFRIDMTLQANPDSNE